MTEKLRTFNRAQAAKALNVSTWVIDKMRADGRLPDQGRWTAAQLEKAVAKTPRAKPRGRPFRATARQESPAPSGSTSPAASAATPAPSSPPAASSPAAPAAVAPASPKSSSGAAPRSGSADPLALNLPRGPLPASRQAGSHAPAGAGTSEDDFFNW